MKNVLLLIIFSFFVKSSFCQENTISDSLETETIKIIKDKRIDQLNETYSNPYVISGYRVQIYSGIKREPANQNRATFLKNHPKTKAHLKYEQPYYKVKVGDFKTKLAALKFKRLISKHFPNSFIVKDEIDIDELVKKNAISPSD